MSEGVQPPGGGSSQNDECVAFDWKYAVAGLKKSMSTSLLACACIPFMNRLFFVIPRCLLALVTCCLWIRSQAAQFKFAAQTLSVPEGFEIELVAAPPLVERPISASFDDEGRLYVTDSSGSNDKPAQQLEAKPHRVLCLEDADGDGRFDKANVFADRLMFPEGCLWFDSSVYVSAPPSIWKLTDTNHDGSADIRQEWHEGKTLTGCANDLHGPFLGLDGRIYWCKGAFATQTYERPGKIPLVTRAAHIFRTRADHSELEPVLTGGMDNPVGVAFTPEGERILCGTFFAPHEPGHRDGLIHAIYGGVYGKPNDVNDSHKKTGDLMPVMTHMGPAAPCSVIDYDSTVFGGEYRHNLFVCAFNLHKVSRHILEPDGATYKTKDSDFVTSDNPDFHPTDVLEDADGSLLVLDTGGWYKICCPTSQLSKPDLLGAIYRIRRVGAAKIADPRGLKLAWAKATPADLAMLLDDGRPAVRHRAMAELAKQGPPAVSAMATILKKGRSVEARRNALWTLTRIDTASARKATRPALKDPDESIRHAGLHAVGLWRDKAAEPQVLALLKSSRPALQRSAAEALGRIGDKQAVPALLAASAAPTDRVLEHSLTYSLIEINDAKATAAGLGAGNVHEKRTALIALDQMDSGDLKAGLVAPLLGSSEPLLRETAAWVAGHHRDWAPALAGFFRDRLAAADLSPADQEQLKQQLALFAGSESIQEIMVSALNDSKSPGLTRRLVLDAMTSAGLKQPPASWSPAVASCLSQNNEALLRSAVTTARVLNRDKSDTFSAPLLRIANGEAHRAELRLEAMAALPDGLSPVSSTLLNFLCENLEPAKPVMTRGAAANVLTKAKLNDEQLLALADTLKSVTPLEMTRVMAAFEHSTSESVGLKLIAALKECKALSALRPDLFRSLLTNYPAVVQQQGNHLLAALDVDSAKKVAHLEELLAGLKDGDIRRGQLVFNSQKAACATCHKMGYLGGNVGPDLTSIGQVRTERDLLEAVIYPSASFVRSFEPYIVTTKSNESYSGILRKDAPDEVILATGPSADVRLARSDITDMRPGTVSIMPAGMDELLTKQELADLVAFLKGTKWGPR